MGICTRGHASIRGGGGGGRGGGAFFSEENGTAASVTEDRNTLFSRLAFNLFTRLEKAENRTIN